MIKKIILIFIIILFCINTASAQFVYVYNADTKTISILNIGTIRLISINQDITSMEEVFEIIPLKSITFQRSQLNARFNNFKGSNITSTTWLYLNTKIPDNSLWEHFPVSINLVAGNIYTVKVIYTKKAEIGSIKIQTIPSFFDTEIPEFTWWNRSWNYSINNAISDGSRPYQISLNISNATGINNATHIFCNGHCNVNFTDIRFTLDNATALPYWIEDNITGKVWVNIAANGAVNMYYGNPSATTSSNGKNTFIFFNDTQKTVGVSEIWTDVGFNLIGDYIIRGKYSATTDDGTIYIADGVSVTGANIYYTPSTGNTRYYDGTFHNIVTTNLNNPLLFEQHMTSTLVHDITVYNSNYQYVGSVTGVAYRDSPTNIHTVFSASDPINTYYILVRKYVLPDIVWATWGTEQLGDFIPPSYSSASHNQSIAGLPTLFSIQYNDETALHPNGQWIFATNNTGEWVNESAVNWIAAPEWANVTKTLNSTVGTVVGYRWYANDNAGNVNNTPIYSLTVTSPPAPIIISWGNNFSNNESLSFTIEMFQNILFNSTANQTLTLWTWTTANQINGSNQNVSFASYNFTIAGIKTVSVYGNNGNGITQTKTWTINVNNTYPEIIPFSMTQSQYDAIISHSDNAGVMGFIGGIIGGAIVIGVLRRKDRR